MNLQLLVNLHNSLTALDPNTPVAVNCTKGKLIYRQQGVIVNAVGIEGLFFCDKDIKLGILTQSDFTNLMDNLKILIQDPLLKDGLLETSIKDYGFDVYKVYKDQSLYGPQLYLRIKLVSFKSTLISSFILNRFSPATKVLLKAIKNEFRRCKSSKLKH